MTPFIAWLEFVPFRVRALFVFWPAVFLICYVIWSRVVSARTSRPKGLWKQLFLWYWQPGDEGGPDEAHWPPSHCPRCGGITFRLSDLAAYCPACGREIVREDGS